MIATLMCSCGRRDDLSVTLRIGNISKNYTVGSEWNDTRMQMISDLRPLWQELNSGTSREFYITSKIVQDVDPVNSGSWTSPMWRFFRNREGRSGIEQLDGEKSLEVISGGSVEWREIEDYLSNHLIQASRVGIRDREQASASNGE